MAGDKSVVDVQEWVDVYNKYALSAEQIIDVVSAGGILKNRADLPIVLAHEDQIVRDTGLLGEVRQFALSLTGALSKSSLQDKCWAVCDGTTPLSQGIIDSIITVTPDLQHKFIRMSNDETSGGIGGAESHNHGGATGMPSALIAKSNASARPIADEEHTHSISSDSNLPPYYELVYFIKVK